VASSAQERLICTNDALSELDTQLDEAYRNAKSKFSVDKAKALTITQRQWLVNVRNRCKDANCLLAVYKARLDAIDPMADKDVTCEEMQRFPELIFSEAIDLGSGTLSPVAVNYQCPESLSQQKFMQPLLELAERIRHDGGPQVCTGTIVHATWRYYHFHLSEAGFAPQMLVQEAAQRQELNQQVARYFRQWSEGSLFNLSQYTEFTSEFDRVLPVLSNHYERKFGLSKKDALAAAKSALQIVVQRAAGDFLQSELKEDSAFRQLVRDSRSGPDEIQRGLAEGHYPDSEIYDALVVPLINNRPLQLVAVLAEALSPAFLQHPTGEQEPLLSFALGSQQNLEYLLRKKAPVNAANDFGKTALFYAIGANNYQAVEALVKAGADVNHAYKSSKELRPNDDECIYPGLTHTRRTPLMHAAQHSNVDMIKMLIKAGARTDAADDLGYNALDFAESGAKKDNGAYLKSLGLEFGSPKYSSEPDQSVREQAIQERISFDGFVSKLIAAPGRPGMLLATITPWDTMTANGKQGLYLLSVADPGHPKVISNLPAVNASDVALSPDGKRAYLIGLTSAKDRPEQKSGLSIVDLTNLDKPSVAEQIEGDFITMSLSPDGKHLYLQERGTDVLHVLSVGSGPARLECRNPFGEVEGIGPVVAYMFASFPGEPLLLIYDRTRKSMLFDVSAPCKPAKRAEYYSAFANQLIGAAGRTMISCGAGTLQKSRITDTQERLAGYEGEFDQCALNTATGSITAVAGHDVAMFRPRGGKRYALTDRFRFPNEKLGGVLEGNAGYIYIGWNGGMGVGRVPTE